jgi:hypothetical protein
MKYLLITCFFLSSVFAYSQGKISPGVEWKDKAGKAINAHGGCVVYDKGTYYWFGEDRTGEVSNGVSCYKSPDLYNWERVGLALATSGPPKADNNDIAAGRTLERPKVMYNKKTNKWVMWSHWETGKDYGEARVCVATSDHIEGPYTLYKTYRPNKHDSRDQTVFRDNDGKAYQFCSTDMNTNINVALLDENYLEPTSTETKIMKDQRCEAPAIFRVGDIYYGFFSGTTGWDPNPGRSAYTDNILGDWTTGNNFAVDPQKDLAYQSQSAYVFKAEGKNNAYIYVGDRWNAKDVGGSYHVWLPISMRSGYPTVKWYDHWDLSVFDGMYRYKRAKEIVPGNTYALLEKQSNRLVSKPADGFTIADDNDTINLNLQFIATNVPNVYKLKDSKTGKFIESLFGTLRLNPGSSSGTQSWKFTLQPDGYYKIKNVKDSKYLSVSGSATFTGTNLYLSDLSEEIPQDFAVYFDSKTYPYKEADIFSTAYIQDNQQQIEKQAK